MVGAIMRSKSLLFVFVLLAALPLFARRFVLQVSPELAPSIAGRYELVIIKQIPNHDLFLVSVPDGVDVNSLISQLNADPDVAGFEQDKHAASPESRAGVTLDQSTAGILDTLSNVGVVSYFGAQV